MWTAEKWWRGTVTAFAVMVAMTATASLGAADDNFSKAIPAGDFSAAGLAKLSAAELARLDALVRDFKSGALEAARREATVAAEGRVKAEANAARAEAEMRATKTAAEAKARAAEEAAAKKSETSLLAKARVLLTPGTQIDYTTVESRIVGEFRGWAGRTIFTLENGQRWQSAGEGSYYSPLVLSPAVKIAPGVLGTFWLTVEGVKSRVKVTLVGAPK